MSVAARALQKQMTMSFCFSVTHLAKTSCVRQASCIAVQLKQKNLGGSLTFQISFQGQVQ